jgi:phage tail sheath protein FI
MRSSCASAFVQVAYPWLRLRAGSLLPGGLEPPDGSLAGILASNALRRGTFASAGGTPTPGVLEVDPELSAEQLARVVPPGAAAASHGSSSLAERISVFGPTSAGMQLLTDVTTATDVAYQPANINRLTSAIVRTARLAGEMAVFDNNGDALWARLREGISVFLTDLWRDGALDGATAAEAFTVRCDRATMTQRDLDAGRAIVTVEFAAASPITEITIVLGLDEGGQVSLRETRLAERKEAA